MAAAATGLSMTEERENFLKSCNYPLVERTDMPEDMRFEAIELCTVAAEKHPDNLERAAILIKESMDKKFGAPWHVVLGGYFAFNVTSEVKNLLHVYFGGNLAVLLWKAQ